MQPKNEKSLAVGVAEIATAFLSHANHGVPPEGVPALILSIANAFRQAGQNETLLSTTAIAATAEEPAAAKQADAPVATAAPAPVEAPAAEAPAPAAPVEAPAEAGAAPATAAEPAASRAKTRRKAAEKTAAASQEPEAVSEPIEAVSEQVAETAPVDAGPVDPLEEKFGDRVLRTTWMNMKPEDAIKPNEIICLIDGQGRKMLHRHLKSKHGMTPEEYREWFNLPDDYPMTAPGYSKEKSAYAKEVGLGTTAFAEKTKTKATPKLARRQRGAKATGKTAEKRTRTTA